MNGRRVQELKDFIVKFYPNKVGDKSFFRFVKKRFMVKRGEK